jgi:hypothetical protein
MAACSKSSGGVGNEVTSLTPLQFPGVLSRRIPRKENWRAFFVVLGAALLTGCSGPRLAPVDLSAPGWRVQEVAAVWRPRREAPELSGELLLATHPSGERLVQFSKQALPLVTAQVATNGWTLSSSLRAGRFGGRARPTERVPWFQFSQLPPAAPRPASRWRLDTTAEGHWRLTEARTGETLEGIVP